MYARCMLKGRIILVSEGMTASEAHQVKMEHAGNLQSAIQMALRKSQEKNCSATGREYDTKYDRRRRNMISMKGT